MRVDAGGQGSASESLPHDISETFTINTNEDDIDERSETFSVALSGASNLTVSSSAGTATGTINDDDATPTVSLSLSMSGSIGENSTGNVAVTASLNHPSTDPTTVTVSAAAVSPAEAGDFSRVGSALTIAAGRKDITGTVTLTTADNDVDAADKSVTVSANATNTQGIAANPGDITLTITDDDERGLRFLPAEYSVREVSIDRYSVSLTSEPTADVTLTAAPSDTGLLRVSPISGQSLTDVGASMTLTFTPRNWSSPQRVGVLMQGDSDEEEDSTTIRHTAAGGDYAGHAEDYEVTIVDTSQEPTSITLRVDTPEIRENAGLTLVTLRAALDGSTLDEDTVVAVTVEPSVLTFMAGNWSDAQTLTVSAGDDADSEDHAATVSHAVAGADYGSNNVTAASVAVTVDDDDGRGVRVSERDLDVDEGGSATYTVRLNTAPSGDVTVTPSISGSSDLDVQPASLTFGTGDWNVARTLTLSVAGVTATPVEDFEEIADVTLTIPAGATSGQATFDLLPVDDAIDETDETLRLTGTAPGLEAEPAAGLELTITDNDETPTVSLSLTPETIREDLGRSRVTATLDHPSSERTTLSVSTTAVAPAAARDIAQAGTTLTILPGETRSSGSVLIEALDNAMPDDDKRFTVSATAENALGVVAPSDRTLTVSDDETPSTSVILEVSRGFIMEGRRARARR